MNLIQRLILLVGIAGVIAAVVLALLPLPSVTEFGATISSCGPGLSSESALGVKLNPNSVNEGSNGQSPAQAQAFVDYCQSLANDRLVVVAVIGGASIVGAALGIWVMGIPRVQSRMQ